MAFSSIIEGVDYTIAVVVYTIGGTDYIIKAVDYNIRPDDATNTSSVHIFCIKRQKGIKNQAMPCFIWHKSCSSESECLTL